MGKGLIYKVNCLKMGCKERSSSLSYAHKLRIAWKSFGELSEWPKEHAWKVCIPQGIEGSNPSLTAIYLIQVFDFTRFKSILPS